MFIIKLMQTQNNVLTICRKTLPSLRASAMRDFFDILKENNLYKQAYHNKTENHYMLNNNLVEFMSLDQPQKKRGTKRNLLWMNEANEFLWEDYKQLAMRTSGQIFLDYNPSEEYHWIYDKIIPRKDCKFIHSTYRDNPFIEKAIIEEIEALRECDPDGWTIYGEGLPGKSTQLIYPKWKLVDQFPDIVDQEEFGLDFGFNNPTALIRAGLKDQKELFLEEWLYETRLTNFELIQRLEVLFPPYRRHVLIKADCEAPDRIEEIRQAGFNCVPVKKGRRSVHDGIDVMKRFNIHITKNSVNLQKEIKNYKWKKDPQTEQILDEPVKYMDHGMDAARYAVGNEAEPVKVDNVEVVYQEDIDDDMEEVRIGDY